MHIRKLESESTDDSEIQKDITKSLTTKLDEELLSRIKNLVEESHKALDKPAANTQN
jgi:hypothetical protein